jgi:hypothetical protein
VRPGYCVIPGGLERAGVSPLMGSNSAALGIDGCATNREADNWA